MITVLFGGLPRALHNLIANHCTLDQHTLPGQETCNIHVARLQTDSKHQVMPVFKDIPPDISTRIWLVSIDRKAQPTYQLAMSLSLVHACAGK